ncbi:NADP-dependent oxidoreductase [Candidatus Woesebacteria bacterium]|nr:NADP-dependent oxidoreductase [Candidatus Woesebacteria bacterium]
MKAAQIIEYGGSENIQIYEVDVPTLKEGQVLVQVHAASLNPFDTIIRSGVMQQMMPFQMPITLGGDFSGVITEVADGVTEFTIGDIVYGSANIANGGSGSLAEYVAANVDNISIAPHTVSLVEAAALPLVGSSAIQALEEHMKLSSGQKILIHGGAGGIGHIAIQLAKKNGAYVITTASADDMAFVKSLGADEVIDYKKKKFEDVVHDVDAVYDTIGGETTERSFLVLKQGGILVSMKGPPSSELAQKYGVTVIGQNTKTNTFHLNHLRELVDTEVLHVRVDQAFELVYAKDAFERLDSHPQGKVVVKVDVQ